MRTLQVSPNGRYFVDQENHPVYWLGDTQWNLFRCHTIQDAELIIDNRIDKGFTCLQVMLLGFSNGVEGIPVCGEAFPEGDPAKPNLEYFKHVDAVIELALSKGMILVIGLDHPTIRLVDQKTAYAYGMWIGQRYAAYPNLIWIPTYSIPEGENLAIMRQVVAGLKQSNDGHLLTSHPDPACPVATSGIAHGEDWLDFHCIQTFSAVDLIYPSVSEDYRRHSPKPVVMAEGAYEEGPEYGFSVTPYMVRKQAYLSCFAGGFHSYGHNDNWRVHSSWASSLDAPGAQQISVLGHVFASLSWWDLIPSQSIFVDKTQEASIVTHAAMCTQSGDLLLIYLSCPASIEIRLDKLLTSANAEAYWIDPRNGSTLGAGRYSTLSPVSFTCPSGWEDALLVIK